MRWAIYALIALVAAAIIGIALFPLSLALDLADAPIEGEPSGTIWRGEIRNASAQGYDLGLVKVAGKPLALLSGAGAGDLAVAGPLLTGTAVVRAARETVEAMDIDAVAELTPLEIRGPLGTNLAGSVVVTGDGSFGPDGCIEADLDVSTDAIATMVERFGAEGFDMTGPATCQNGVLVADLTGQGADGSARTLIRLRPGRYVTELTLLPADPRAAQALTAYGFRRTPDGYTVVTRGTY